MMRLKKYTSEFGVNIQLAFPVVMGSLGHVLVGLADDIMVGTLGATELAATSLGNALVFIAISIGIGFSFALTPLISEADGENDVSKGRLLFQHGLILNFSIGIIMFAFLVFAEPILQYLDQPPEVVVLAIPYYRIVSLSMIPLMLFQGLKQFADGMSKTKYAMWSTIMANVVNIGINYFLIYGIWIFPRMELVGAALGTFVSRIAMLIVLFFMLKSQPIFKPYFKILKKLEIKWNYFIKIIKLGLPTAMQIFFEVAFFVSAVLLAGKLGAFPQAANQIALKMSSTTFMVAIGVGVAATIRIGNLKGKNDFVKLRTVALSNQLLITFLTLLFTGIFIAFNTIIPLAFTDEPLVIEIAKTLIIIAGIFQLSDGLQAVIMASLRGLQDVWIPTLITFISYWVIGFPISYYLGMNTRLETQGIWYGMLLGLTVSSILLFLRFNYITKKLIVQNQ